VPPATPELEARIVSRAASASLSINQTLSSALASYLSLLARWNRTINLTSFELDDPSDAALDRLLIEPLVAARHLRPQEEFVLDVGSGGGSPAIPLKLAKPGLRMTLVESKSRKAAFLREAARHLELTDFAVEARRLEDISDHLALRQQFDVATVRAVRVDARLLDSMGLFLWPDGRVFVFESESAATSAYPGWRVRYEQLVSGLGGRLGIWVRASARHDRQQN
jgi:16S rRNA (guanine527-N7)-methyltransferase